MLYVGLDLSRKRLDFDAHRSSGELFERGAVPPDADGLDGLVRRLGDADVLAVIESMNGARFVHDRLELAGWDVRIGDALKAKARLPHARTQGRHRRCLRTTPRAALRRAG
jgi:transposase